MDHRASAEHLLDLAATERDAAWAQVFATRAMAHATLAGLLRPIKAAAPAFEHHSPAPPPVIWCSTDRDMSAEPIVVWRGQDLRD